VEDLLIRVVGVDRVGHVALKRIENAEHISGGARRELEQEQRVLALLLCGFQSANGRDQVAFNRQRRRRAGARLIR
jgi:hypothetical protein